MRLSRALLILLLLVLATSCASIRDRRAVRRSLSDQPIPPERWRKIRGVYTGPVRADVHTFFGTRGAATSDARLEIYGTPLRPLVFFKWQTHYVSALNPVGDRTEVYTNIPTRQFGVKARIRPSTHADPDRMLLKLRPNVFSPTAFTTMVVYFRHDGSADVDYLGHFGWRGFGRFNKLPIAPSIYP